MIEGLRKSTGVRTLKEEGESENEKNPPRDCAHSREKLSGIGGGRDREGVEIIDLDLVR